MPVSPKPSATAPRSELRRARILDAAQRVFSVSGFRGATMEAIAAEAAVAKATAYSYFPDKEAMFRAVAERIAAEMADGVEAAIAAAKSPAEGIVTALLAKEQLAFRIVRTSPHSRDLFESTDRLAAEAFASAERRKLNALAKALEKMRVDRPEQAARLIAAAAGGVASKATSPEGLAGDLDRVLRALLKGWSKRSCW
jgi:AcrR family transcriptional regulator